MSGFFDDLERQLHDAARREIDHREGHRAPRRRWRRPRALALLAVGVVGVATPALADVFGVRPITSIWDPGVPPATRAARGVTGPGCALPSPASQIAQISTAPASPQLTSILGVLRRPSNAQDIVPVRSIQRRLAQLTEFNPTAIRYVGSAAGQRYFVVPNLGTRARPALPPRCLARLTPLQRRAYLRAAPAAGQAQICLISATVSGCGTTPANLGAHGAELSVKHGATTDVVGLVPDGVTALTITYGRSKRTFPVDSNFFSYTITVNPGQAPTATIWHLADGAIRRVS